MVTFPAEPAVGTATIVDPEPVAPQVAESAFMPPSTPRPEPDLAPSLPQAQAAVFDAERPAYFTYTVESGDSLTSIAIQFGICPDHIIWNNSSRLADNTLQAGLELVLPGYPGLIHKVRGGETVQRLADEYNTTPAAIIAYPGNNLRSAEDLQARDTVLLPDGFPVSVLEKSREERIAYTNPSSSGYVWPFYGPITTLYGEQRPGYVHTAIDIGGLGRWGAPVIAIAPGRIVAAIQDHPGLGNYIVVAHDDGARSLYAHLANTSVRQGDSVPIGVRLGSLGCTGNSTGTHLHFELWRDGRPVDPLVYLASPQDDARLDAAEPRVAGN
jgi:murein DD-endopeptidase MepM/ murein hydrolase activator NlpD